MTEVGPLNFPALNADHSALLSLTNQLMDALETGQSHDVVGSILNVLTEYVEHHVRALGEAVETTERRVAATAHALFVRALRDSWLDGSRTGLSDDDVTCLKNWLTDWPPVADNGKV